jgi:hypothetical protein
MLERICTPIRVTQYVQTPCTNPECDHEARYGDKTCCEAFREQVIAWHQRQAQVFAEHCASLEWPASEWSSRGVGLPLYWSGGFLNLPHIDFCKNERRVHYTGTDLTQRVAMAGFKPVYEPVTMTEKETADRVLRLIDSLIDAYKGHTLPTLKTFSAPTLAQALHKYGPLWVYDVWKLEGRKDFLVEVTRKDTLEATA